MDIYAIKHETKSRYSYIYEGDKLHLRLKTGKGQVKSVFVKAADQFDHVKIKENHYGINLKTLKTVDMILETETRDYDVWFAEVSGIDTLRINYAFFITDVDENRYIFDAEAVKKYHGPFQEIVNTHEYFNFPCLNPEDAFVAPEWSKSAIWYQFTPTCFSDDGAEAKDNRSGNFRGLTKKMDYIKEMGYTAIYMTPVFQGTDWHLYDTIDYFKISPTLGTEAEFREMIEKAHSLGIRVILDGVFNHCGFQHPFWQDVMKNGEKSKYYSCFCPKDKSKPLFEGTFSNEEEYFKKSARDYNFQTFSFSLHMPKLNYTSPIVRDMVLSVGEYWIKEYDIDGWRLDVSNEVPHEFWREFRKKVKAVKEDAYILGENWDDSYPWLMGDQFDGVMNYGTMNAIRRFLHPNENHFNALDFKYAINELSIRYPKNVNESIFNFVSSHDVDRVNTSLDNNIDLVKLAYVLLLTYSGAPCIYYGDEIGISGTERENRVPMIFDPSRQNLDLLQHVKKLVALRKSTSDFQEIISQWLLTDTHSNTILFQKGQHLVLLHNSEKPAEVEIPKEIQRKKLLDVYGNEGELSLQDKISLKAYEFRIYQLLEA
ncbi:MAG: alpha amylase N-terminal ig-like domain-containing protein [Eubacteriales bacterium]